MNEGFKEYGSLKRVTSNRGIGVDAKKEQRNNCIY